MEEKPALPPVDLGVVNLWYTAQSDLAKAKLAESKLREQVFGMAFPEGSYKLEGTNSYALPDNYLLKAVTSLNRTLSIELLRALAPELSQLGVVPDDLVRWEAKLDLPAYRALTEQQRRFFDQCMEIKPGTPQMKIELPAKFKGKDNLSPPTVTNGPQVPF